MGRLSRRTIFFLTLTLLGVFAAEVPAEAQLRYNVAVMPFEGHRRHKRRARQAVVRGIRDEVELVSARDVRDAAQMVGYDLGTPEGIQRVCADLSLRLFITGAVDRIDGRLRTLVTVYGPSGAVLGSRDFPVPRGRGQRAISSGALELVQESLATLQQQELEAERAREATPPPVVIDEELTQDDEDDEEATPAALPIFAGYIGYLGRTRDFTVEVPGASARTYEAGVFGNLTLRLESFPLGGSDSAAKGLYAQAAFRIAIGLTTQEEFVQGDGSVGLRDIDGTSVWHFNIDAGYVYPILEDLLRVGAIVGFGLDTFAIGENQTLSSTSYPYLRVGGVIDVRIYESYLRARVDGGVRIPFGIGEVGDDFGPDGGAIGGDVGLALGGIAGPGIAYNARVGFVRYGLSFDGMGSVGSAESGADQSIEFGVELGYAYR